MLGMADEIGSLGVGMTADISVLSLLNGAFELADNSGVSVTARQLIMPEFCLRAGAYFAATSALIPPAVELVAA